MQKNIKKTVSLWVSALLVSQAASANCVAPNKIYEILKPTLKEITWIDINPVQSSLCDLILRYYPCNQKTSDELVTQFTAAVGTFNCKIISLGKSYPKEGYCARGIVKLSCSPFSK